MKLSDIILERGIKDDRGAVSMELVKLAKEIGSYAGLDVGTGSENHTAIDGILFRYFLEDYDFAVKKYGNRIESIEVGTTEYGPKAAVLKINFKPGMEPKGLTAADVRSGGPLD